MFLTENCNKICISFYVIVFLTRILYVHSEKEEGIPEDLLQKIYESYKGALNIEEGTVSARRVFSENKQYDIHVMKLDEVNGKKRHNLMIKESNATNPLIYINNPVETKLPHAYLTYEEFKKVLTDRVKLLRQQFVTKVNMAFTKPPNPKNQEKAKVVKEFKTFLDRLIKLQAAEIDANYKKGKNSSKRSKTISQSFRVHTLQTDTEFKNVTKATHTPHKTNKTTKPTAAPTKKEDDLIDQNLNQKPILRAQEGNFTEENKTETPIFQTVTETTKPYKVSEDEVNEVRLTEAVTETELAKVPEVATIETQQETDATSISTTIKTKTKRTTLGRPLVWMEEDEKQKEADMQANV